MARSALIFLLAAASLLGSVTATAQSDQGDLSAAREAFDRGVAAYDAALFAQAEDAFETALRLMPEDHERRSFLFLNLGLAVEGQGGRDDEALVHYRRFVEEAGAVAPAADVARARERIVELEARIARRAPREPSPGAPTPSSGSLHPLGPVLMATGGGVALAGGIVAVFGLIQREDVLSACDGTSCPPTVRDEADGLADLALAADLLLWPGLAVAAAGAVLTLVLTSTESAYPVEVACHLEGCTLRGRF